MDLAEWFSAALLVSGVGYLALASFVWSHRQVAGSGALIVMLLAVKLWTIFYALELSTSDVDVARWWSTLKFIGIVALPPALWAFVWQYTGRGSIPRRVLALLMIHPVVVFTMLLLPQTHDLIHFYPAEPQLILGRSPYPENGYLYWFHSGYVAVVMLSAVSTLMVQLARIAPAYRRQGAVLIAAALIPFLGNVIWTAAPGGWGTVDPTPFLFLITGVVLVWGFMRLRLLKLVPVARSVVIEQMGDGVLVLDVYGRVVDANPAASALLGRDRATMVGRRGEEFLPALAPLLAAHAGGGSHDAPRATVETEVLIRQVGEADGRNVGVSLTGVTDATGRETARLVVLHDVTERRRTEHRLRELLDEQTRLADTLQHSLRPATLPDLVGVKLAARSIPATSGGVSGDFYDVHPAGPGRSAFVLGDVSGKGVEAAVATSMARYTVRTLSAQGWRPREVLAQLNQALLVGDDPERFCTVVYGHLEPHAPGRPGAGGGVRLTLALGGHPPPLLRLRDRTVKPVGVPGTALGLMPVVDVHEVRIDLHPGDVLLAYTDGVTEARDGGELFGDERLARVLAAVGARPPRPAEQPVAETMRVGSTAVRTDVATGLEVRMDADEHAARDARAIADEVADGVLAAVRAFASYRDDVALLVLAVT